MECREEEQITTAPGLKFRRYENWGKLHSGWGNRGVHLDPLEISGKPSVSGFDPPLMVGGGCAGAERIPSEIAAFTHHRHHDVQRPRDRR